MIKEKEKESKKKTNKKVEDNKKNLKNNKIENSIKKTLKKEVEKIRVDFKNKKLVYIIPLLISFLLVFVIYLQFKTVEQTDIQTLEAMREVELRSEIASVKKKIEEKEEKIDDVNIKIQEYLSELKNSSSAPELLYKDLKEAEQHLGFTGMKGAGIIITLADTNESEISSTDILMLVNQLKIAEAEAISINQERLIASSEIVTVNNNLIYVNGRRQNGPYVIKAIGNGQELESAITTKGGTLNEMKASNKSVSHRLSNEVEIVAYEGDIDFKYAR